MKGKKIIIAVLIVCVVIAIASIGVNYWVKFQLPRLINERSKIYAITYKNLDIAVFSGSATATNVVIVPKAALHTTEKAGIYAKVKKIDIRNFKIWSVLFSDEVSAESLSFEKPEIVLYKKDDKAIAHPEKIKHPNSKSFDKIISVSDIYLSNGNFKVVRVQTTEPIMAVSNINLKIDGIKVTDSILKGKIPFGYKHYSITCDSIYANGNPFYDITTDKISMTNESLDVNGIRFTPKYSRKQFVRSLKTEKDMFTVLIKSIRVRKLDWGYHDKDLFVKAHLVAIDRCHADVYRNKIPPDDFTKKYLYNKLLRDLDFELKIDTLKIQNSLLSYEEEKSFNHGSGKLIFNRFNLTALHICSGFKKKKLADVTIKVKCQFMDASPLDMDWRFNAMDKTDGFNIKGTIFNLDAENMAAFTKPYMNVTTKGTLNEVYFNFTGNDKRDSGTFAVKYDDLKFTIYKKNDREKKNKLLSAIGNLFVKNDTKGKVKDAQVDLERIPEKSFFNFLWRSIAEGLKKILV